MNQHAQFHMSTSWASNPMSTVLYLWGSNTATCMTCTHKGQQQPSNQSITYAFLHPCKCWIGATWAILPWTSQILFVIICENMSVWKEIHRVKKTKDQQAVMMRCWLTICCSCDKQGSLWTICSVPVHINPVQSAAGSSWHYVEHPLVHLTRENQGYF